MIEDIKKASDFTTVVHRSHDRGMFSLQMLSVIPSANGLVLTQVVQLDYTIGPEIRLDTYHVGIVRSPLTRNIGIRFGDIRDEIHAACEDLIPAGQWQEWSVGHCFMCVNQKC